MDRNAILNPGEVANFDGLDFHLLAQLEIKGRQRPAPYTENIIDRQNPYVYGRGKDVYQLVSQTAGST